MNLGAGPSRGNEYLDRGKRYWKPNLDILVTDGSRKWILIVHLSPTKPFPPFSSVINTHRIWTIYAIYLIIGTFLAF
jgi:hypothetical protein